MFFSALLLAISATSIPLEIDRCAGLQSRISHLTCIDSNFAVAGQPEESAFDAIARAGFRSVLNLRTSGEGIDLEREKTAVQSAGLRYLALPVAAAAPRMDQADEFLKFLGESGNQPMLIHCGTANRAAAFWMIHRIVDEGWRPDDAAAEARTLGMTSASLEAFAREAAARRQVTPPPCSP